MLGRRLSRTGVTERRVCFLAHRPSQTRAYVGDCAERKQGNATQLWSGSGLANQSRDSSVIESATAGAGGGESSKVSEGLTFIGLISLSS